MSEHTEQVKLFQWAAHRLGVYPELALMFAIPNAGKRRGSQGGWMVAEGLKRGVPDVCLPVARGGYHGLFLELKHGRNKATVEQLYWQERLLIQGYRADVVYEFEGARAAIIAYLELQPCGHPRGAIRGDGVTHYCGMCEDEA